MPKGIYDRTKTKVNKRIPPEGNYSTQPRNTSRVWWTEEEIKKIAEEWVLLRSVDPITPPGTLFEKAQRTVLPGDRQRSLPGVQTHKQLFSEICRQWKSFLDKPPAPAPEAEAKVVTIEVPRKLTFEEMLGLLDEPALESLLCAKRLARETTFHEIMRGIAASAGATNLPKVAPFVPKLDAFEAGTNHAPRIAVVGLSSIQHDALQGEVKAANLHASVRYVDGKDSTAIHRCEYAIICRRQINGSNGASPADGDRIIGALGRSRVILIDDCTVGAVLQQVRNICSRK